MRSSNHAYKSGECHLGGQCIASSDPCCHASPPKSTPAAKCRDGVNAALNASKKAPVWCSIYKDPDYAGRGGRRVAGVMDSTWRSRSRGRVFGGGLTIAVCDSLTGWSVLRLLSQFVRLLCRRKARSAHTLLQSLYSLGFQPSLISSSRSAWALRSRTSSSMRSRARKTLL